MDSGRSMNSELLDGLGPLDEPLGSRALTRLCQPTRLEERSRSCSVASPRRPASGPLQSSRPAPHPRQPAPAKRRSSASSVARGGEVEPLAPTAAAACEARLEPVSAASTRLEWSPDRAVIVRAPGATVPSVIGLALEAASAGGSEAWPSPLTDALGYRARRRRARVHAAGLRRRQIGPSQPWARAGGRVRRDSLGGPRPELAHLHAYARGHGTLPVQIQFRMPDCQEPPAPLSMSQARSSSAAMRRPGKPTSSGTSESVPRNVLRVMRDIT